MSIKWDNVLYITYEWLRDHAADTPAAMQPFVSVKSVYVESDPLSEHQARQLAEGLVTFAGLQRVHLTGLLGVEHIEALAPVMRRVSELDVHVRADALAAFAAIGPLPAVEQLVLMPHEASTHAHAHALAAIVGNMPNLTSLDVGRTNDSDEAFIPMVRSLPSATPWLRKLELIGNHMHGPIVPARLDVIERLPGLDTIDLSGNRLRSNGIGIDLLARVLAHSTVKRFNATFACLSTAGLTALITMFRPGVTNLRHMKIELSRNPWRMEKFTWHRPSDDQCNYPKLTIAPLTIDK
jgi:hypothetical protein